MTKKEKKYYAYLLPDGAQGIAEDWVVCEKMVKGVRDARYRSFKSRPEAEQWLSEGAQYEKKIAPKLAKGIYFDAGTGRGEGVEASVTDEKGKDLLAGVLPKKKLNKFGKLPLRGATNNFGELTAAKYALELALRDGTKRVFGDSRLILEYWSRGFVNKDISAKTAKLAKEVQGLRAEFEAGGGRMEFISGDWNPADLGFH